MVVIVAVIVIVYVPTWAGELVCQETTLVLESKEIKDVSVSAVDGVTVIE